ncbi:PH domain-containing protein [Candidatus Woesearchaeota archaeon]|nr:PH domain-containing protein [Candidatus Woesearchaeota archaeon]
MEKHLLVLKPNLASAILPLFFKSTLKMLPFGIALLITAYALNFSGIINYSSKAINITAFIVFLALAFLPMKYNLMRLHFTKYYFYKTHVMSIFKFIKVKRSSLPYTQITNIKIIASPWDRLWRTGKIALNTAERGSSGLMLYYIKDPYEIEKMLHSLIQKYYGNSIGKLSDEK